MTSLTGLRRLVRLVVRRDRIRLSVWVLGVCGLMLSSAASLPPLYPDQRAIDDYARLFGDNPALVAFAGPGYGFAHPNIGVILVNETQLWTCVAVALMSIFLINRHTRSEEDAERTEVIRSSVVGRHAPVAAAVVVVGAANLLIAAICAVGLVALGYATIGSLALAASVAACGLTFTAITAVVAQVASGSRATLGLASVALGVAFVLRALGDIGHNALRWLSPIGWAQSVRAYAGERWWAPLLCVVFSVAATTGAFWLSTRRDLGSGLLPQRAGPARAARSSTHPVGLAFRLQRGSVLGWAAGVFLVGVVYGSIGRDVEDMIAENPTYADFLAQASGASITDSYFATSLALMALLAAGFGIASALRLRSEESAGRAETVLASSVSRWRWAASHLAVSAAGTVVVVAAGGLGAGLSFAVVSNDAGQVARMVGASLVTVPAVLVLVGVAAALFGLVPRIAVVAWAALAAAVLVDLFGGLLQLPDWSRAISPLHHVPALPAAPLRLLPLVVLLVIATGAVGAGLVAFRERDLRTG